MQGSASQSALSMNRSEPSTWQLLVSMSAECHTACIAPLNLHILIGPFKNDETETFSSIYEIPMDSMWQVDMSGVKRMVSYPKLACLQVSADSNFKILPQKQHFGPDFEQTTLANKI